MFGQAYINNNSSNKPEQRTFKAHHGTTANSHTDTAHLLRESTGVNISTNLTIWALQTGLILPAAPGRKTRDRRVVC
jgi:hypothetical protein